MKSTWKLEMTTIPQDLREVLRIHAEIGGGTVKEVADYYLRDALRGHTDRLLPKGPLWSRCMKLLDQ